MVNGKTTINLNSEVIVGHAFLENKANNKTLACCAVTCNLSGASVSSYVITTYQVQGGHQTRIVV